MEDFRTGINSFSLTLIISISLTGSSAVLLAFPYLPYSFWVKISIFILTFLFLVVLLTLVGGPVIGPFIEDMSSLVPDSADLPGKGWERLEEERISGSEDEISELETSFEKFDSGIIRIFDLEGKKSAFTVIKMSSFEEAKKIFSDIFQEWEMGDSYSISLGEEGFGVKPSEQEADATIFRIGNHVGLTVLGGEGVKKRDSVRHAEVLERKMKNQID